MQSLKMIGTAKFKNDWYKTEGELRSQDTQSNC